jgi:hypothetical protein
VFFTRLSHFLLCHFDPPAGGEKSTFNKSRNVSAFQIVKEAESIAYSLNHASGRTSSQPFSSEKGAVSTNDLTIFYFSIFLFLPLSG